jgi:hypothetical protein
VGDNIATDSGASAIGGGEGCPGVEHKYMLHGEHAGDRKGGLQLHQLQEMLSFEMMMACRKLVEMHCVVEGVHTMEARPQVNKRKVGATMWACGSRNRLGWRSSCDGDCCGATLSLS